ncbi:MAG: DUF2599 domain-containing protein [Gordonia sp. (in: high G+C Gram-positive bacteria)]
MIRRVSALLVVLFGAAMLGGCGNDDATPAVSSRDMSTAFSSSSVPDSTVASTDTSEPPSAPPPYIDRVAWAQTAVGPSLQIYPTPAGRQVSGTGVEDEAWGEVLKLDSGADTPGMRAQFDCHWTFARLMDPDKPSWNLEPDRPVVSESDMIAARCNPGGPEE